MIKEGRTFLCLKCVKEEKGGLDWTCPEREWATGNSFEVNSGGREEKGGEKTRVCIVWIVI